MNKQQTPDGSDIKNTFEKNAKNFFYDQSKAQANDTLYRMFMYAVSSADMNEAHLERNEFCMFYRKLNGLIDSIPED